MAVGRFVLTADVVVPAGTAATVVAGQPGTGGASGFGSAATTGGPLWPTSYARGQVIVLDTGSALYTALSASLRAWVDGQDSAGRPGISN
jgi:hypothetical protein